MPETSWLAPPQMSVKAIRHAAEQMCAIMDMENNAKFPIMFAIEKCLDEANDLLKLEVWPDLVMDKMEGLYFRDDSGTDRIVLCDRVYKGGWLGQWRARRIAAHELGHWVLHSHIQSRRQIVARDVSPANLPANDPGIESEADVFAIELLMPIRHIYLNDSVLDVATRFGAPRAIAERRMRAASFIRSQEKEPPAIGRRLLKSW